MSCATCMWYVAKVPATPASVELGRCRRRAPELAGYPVVFPADWCGEHKLDENKIAPAPVAAVDETTTEGQGLAKGKARSRRIEARVRR